MRVKLILLILLFVIVGVFTDVMIEPLFLIASLALIYFNGGKLVVNKNILIGFFIVFLWSVSTIYFMNYTYGKFFQQFCLLFFFVNAYYVFFEFNKGRIDEIFNIYIKISYYLSIIALFQFLLYFIFQVDVLKVISINNELADTTVLPRILRVSSICREPSNFSRLITPAFGYFLFKGFSGKKDIIIFTIITAALFLTFSTMSYIIVLLMIMYKYLILKKSYISKMISTFIILIFSFFLISAIISNSYSNSDRSAFSDISNKISDVYVGFQELNPNTFELLNLSSYATMSNIWVAINADSRLVGTGLGTHEQNYKSKYQSKFKYYGLNMQEGYALGNRIYSEFGILGICLVVLFLFYYHDKRNIVNICVFFLLLTLIFRGGHYTRYGTIFFIFLYYYSNKESKLLTNFVEK